MSLFRRFSYFSNNVDGELLDQCGVYDRTLVHANTIRLLATVAFVFFFSLYGFSTLFPLWMAAIAAFLLTGTVYGFDVAILGYEWTLHRTVSRFWFINEPAVFLLKAVQILPRLFYALVIAYGVATLAEIAFQHKAIDRELRSRTRELNSEYFQRLDTLKDEYETRARDIDEKVSSLESAIAKKRDPTSEQSKKQLQEQYEQVEENIGELTARVEALRTLRTNAENELGPLRVQANELESTVSTLIREMALELEHPRCEIPGDKVCEGRRWLVFKNERIDAEMRLATVRSRTTSLEASLKEFDSALESATASQKEEDANRALILAHMSEIEGDGRSLAELLEQLATFQGFMADLASRYAADDAKLRSELRSAGFFDPAEYDIFDRYVALRAIHEDAERGAAAKEISYGIRAIVMFIELVPAFVVLFFMPFSFYASRMRERRDIELFHSHKRRLDRELLLNVKMRKHAGETLNQKAKFYHAKQVFRTRKHAAKVDANMEIERKAEETATSSIDAKIAEEQKRIVLEAEKRKRMQAERATQIVGDTLKQKGN